VVHSVVVEFHYTLFLCSPPFYFVNILSSALQISLCFSCFGHVGHINFYFHVMSIRVVNVLDMVIAFVGVGRMICCLYALIGLLCRCSIRENRRIGI